ncbi:MAG: hypothetical protein E7107_02195 [Prevotella sp.]|nr:hypothetical protein [Prevotella sp.]
MMMLLAASAVQAQIVIGGSVYGGGNAGDTGQGIDENSEKKGTKVTIYSGDINAVYGGARMAKIGGSAFVHIDGEHASNYIVINKVYGGNDISGTIGSSATLPTELVDASEDGVDNSWNAFVRISSKLNGPVYYTQEEIEAATEGDDAYGKTTNDIKTPATIADDNQKIYIGQLFGGGNGDYDYTSDDSPYKGKEKPELDQTYLDIHGGSIVYAYGGGNAATVTKSAVICVDNPSKVVNSIEDPVRGELLTNDRFQKQMGINTGFSYPSSDEFQIGRLFGGNNMAEMKIRPTWHLQSGKVRNIYSGGNRGAMTYENGLLLKIDSKDMVIDNVYGGCRMADVNPGKTIEEETIDGVWFPGNYAARVLILAGDINNVYGGNDITGKVYGGNAVGIHCSIKGDVYGGGNGAYPYTDNKDLKDHDIYGDLYYGDPDNPYTGTQSVEALNAFRPNAEAVSIRVVGKFEKDSQGKVIENTVVPTIIGGAIYCGGNCATLRNDDPEKDATAQLKIGSYVIADKVFLGNNGERMKDADILERYAKYIDENGDTKDVPADPASSTLYDFSQMDLKSTDIVKNGKTQFDLYMDGVAMDIRPEVKFDGEDPNDSQYEPYSSYFGSFYCGGNVGSMTKEGKITLNFDKAIIIYEKLVGGCNNAYISASTYNTEYHGGITGSAEVNGNGNKDKLEINLSGLKLQPKRWENSKKEKLVWNTISASTGENVQAVEPGMGTSALPFTPSDLDRRFKGGNIYGGCYMSGHVNGNVVININSTLVDRKGENAIFDVVEEKEGEAILYGHDSFVIKERHTGVILSQQGMDILGKALNVFGGGYGEQSEIWGSTTINLNKGYTFQIFGGGQEGPIGKKTGDQYVYDEKYSTTVNLHHATIEGDYRGADGDDDDMAEAEFIYGGGFEGPICGNTHINLGNGRVFNTFAGSCNADIYGHTETHIGQWTNANNETVTGFPWVRDHLYGANDMGGRIFGGGTTGAKNFISEVREDIRGAVYNPNNKTVSTTDTNPNPDVTVASAYVEYTQGRVDYIFGGCYGNIDYTDRYYKDYTNDDGTAKGDFTKPRMESAFVHFKPSTHARNSVNRIYGAGQGYTQDSDRDLMQNRSYVLIDIPEDDQVKTTYQNLMVFGAGDYSGIGMGVAPATARANASGVEAAAVIDLIRGNIKDVFGASYNEGVTRRTIVNVPAVSTIQVQRIFGGAYGVTNQLPCDVYEAHVNYKSPNAVASGIPTEVDKEGYQVAGGIYGGNNSYRRTLYSEVNISSKVVQKKAEGKNPEILAKVFGAGYGENTWAQYTEINLLSGAHVYEAYGGGFGGMVLNKASVDKWKETETDMVLELGDGYTDLGLYVAPAATNATDEEKADVAAKEAELASLTTVNGLGELTNTNVHIHRGGLVGNYCYAGGLGAPATVSGTTYVGLYGGEVSKDIYAGGTSGAVEDKFKVGAYSSTNPNGFTAGTNAYIAGGTCRNVYGGGWEGSVGYTKMENGVVSEDIPGETHVVIGIRKDQTEDKLLADLQKVLGVSATKDDYGFYCGEPAIQRNAYAGGEGGAVFGTANITVNNGYIGYVYLKANEELDDEGNIISAASSTKDRYEMKYDDETYYVNGEYKGKNRLVGCGNVYGGGYDDNSSVDITNVTLWGGIIRNSVFGGGEIATIGRGATEESGDANSERVLKAIYKAGETHIYMYNGHVLHNVFGGGKGYNELGYGRKNQYYTDGYVFGKTRVNIYGGEVGTADAVANSKGGYGNVFGGGDIGYVYSPSYFTTSRETSNETGSPNHYYYKDGDGHLTEDCSVVVSPRLQVRPSHSVPYGGETYGPYDYVPTEYLNTLKSKKTSSTGWEDLYTGDGKTEDDKVERGVHIYNAVFAGGNVSSNSDQAYANQITVFGNATATLNDVYHQDFITVGTEHTGGLYGGGNLSVVGGYRELNITNYGTDYYGMNEQITLAEYDELTNRERAYFQLEYLCQIGYSDGTNTYTAGTSRITEEKYKNDIDDEHKKYVCQQAYDSYTIGASITIEEYNALDSEYQKPEYWKPYWERFGFCSIYAGRLLNTVQRADFCGVFGSRLVLQGAVDRVADVGDKTAYTINRVGELSLNKQRSAVVGETDVKDGTDPNDEDYKDPENALHGNYFGIYSVVNYLGALTSDVHFNDPRKIVEYDAVSGKNIAKVVDKDKSYYQWKIEKQGKRERNNGYSENQVALASGVYLELTTEKSTEKKKDYGLITGVVELALINVKQDNEGGGYVYAKNKHGMASSQSYSDFLLNHYNKITGNLAYSNRAYTYDENDRQPIETSGNFIHRSKPIIDDCYPNNGVYQKVGTEDGYDKSPAHYWYIKGSVYIYEQEVSAYAGSATAYSKEVKIPLTITAASQGKLKLLNVQPNLFAYWSNTEQTTKIGEDGVKVNNGSETYHLNDVITWWDWNRLTQNEQKYFVRETITNVDTCKINGVDYPKGTYAMLPGQTTEVEEYVTEHKVYDKKGKLVESFDYMFRSSNNISSTTGYVLTFDMDSPKDWDDYYTYINPSNHNSDGLADKISKEAYKALSDENKAKYIEGPTFKLKNGTSTLYGQREYEADEIIRGDVYEDYQTAKDHLGDNPPKQAVVTRAYVAKQTIGDIEAGSAISATAYGALADKSNYEKALLCTGTVQLGENEYLLNGDLIADDNATVENIAKKYQDYIATLQNREPVTLEEALEYVSERLTEAYYCEESGYYGGTYFDASINYPALKSWCALPDDRDNFTFNYDAFDVLVDPDYHGEGYTETYYKSPYSDQKSVDYRAYYTGGADGTETMVIGTRTLQKGDDISREEYEALTNEQQYYTRVTLAPGQEKVYFAKEDFIEAGTPYARGQEITEKDYSSITSTTNKAKIKEVSTTGETGSATLIKYYLYDDGTGHWPATDTFIDESTFNNSLTNQQKNFSIQGMEPTERTTLYVSRESSVKDVTKEKVITVVYQYNYYEEDADGAGVSRVNELHVVNIHLKLESGAPEVGTLYAPPIVLPGNTVQLKAPSVNPGLYEPISNGWEIFTSENDANNHRNGKAFVNKETPLYWYQNEKVWVAYYTKTYLGKTYSNPVTLSVANYHDLGEVLEDKEHHLYVDHPDVMRNSKVYINDETNGLKQLTDFFNLSLLDTKPTTGDLAGHELLDEHVRGCADLDIILHTDLKNTGTWYPIGYGKNECFSGILHGDGYTISGLTESLFDQLCGDVYNLGVTGSFRTAGIANSGEGYVENCWINTTATSVNNVKAFIGNPTDATRKQVVNCYYPKTKNYATGEARPATDQEFYNGTVAYNLNGFYLNKRYYDNASWEGGKDDAYRYLKKEDDESFSQGYYPTTGNTIYKPENGSFYYVENRYGAIPDANGNYDNDFLYADGKIPEAKDVRVRTVTEGTASVNRYAPVWPTDYLFFGQTLTYGHTGEHDDLPTHFTDDNHVYRAPAYYRSKDMGVAHFNPKAVLAAYSAPKSIEDNDLKAAYPNMTAIDFAGHNDNTYKLALNNNLFYQPLLDDAGLVSVGNYGETANLLVYAPARTATSGYANQATYDVLTGYFKEPAFSTYYTDDDYKRVAPYTAGAVVGHLVTSDMRTLNDHLLVDKADFNCPISYTMGDGFRMWYQRVPLAKEFVDMTKGWQGISIPFTAELVTTNQKGEITHFYEGSTTGHEYWLRQYRKMTVEAEDATADMYYPTTGETIDKTYTNSFLWDYYYKGNHSQNDANSDKYKEYYKAKKFDDGTYVQKYSGYPKLTKGIPYLIGLPGATYYEFDLSGNFEAQHTGETAPVKLGSQTITFVSAAAVPISVSDTELDDNAAGPYKGYYFMPNYLNIEVEAPTTSTDPNYYVLASDGGSYEKVETGKRSVTAFRTYFSSGKAITRSIKFNRLGSQFGGEEQEPQDNVAESIDFRVGRHKVIVTSNMLSTTDVGIYNVSGQCIATFDIEPGETIETPIHTSGVYIVRAAHGHYTGKVTIK